ncbi:hypothetical protein SAMN04488510_10231 [Fervidobacterium changbaicum]|uniref:Uncharacterized protein n=1 Tax=Fervidobacterium changbaicum TaxID=310769 RepID=A0ABX5QQY7_9BACT|nr:hypothetical protein [Fervidobacterium changbaicum]QAV32801.1 hypothetical protein CBS1_02925 [Fervidobacterium changbaicum]SDG95004.1 hypothetical protein SAMN04488510_10231 [Fervidobacterium changbaicum]
MWYNTNEKKKLKKGAGIVQKVVKLKKEKTLSQYELIKLANMGDEKAKSELEERLKDTVKKDEKKKDTK